jgi:hypothetical protein
MLNPCTKVIRANDKTCRIIINNKIFQSSLPQPSRFFKTLGECTFTLINTNLTLA